MKYTDEEKEIALFIAHLMSANHFVKKERISLVSQRKLFLKCCAIYADNRNDLEFIAFAERVGGAAYLVESDRVVELETTMENKAVPEHSKALLKQQISEALKPKPKKIPVVRNPTPTKVYLMKNGRNGYHKIGRSVNPIKREMTLQSEEPEIVLIHSWEGTTRHEEGLHELFADKRVRGEWFNLNTEDVEKIHKFMNGDLV